MQVAARRFICYPHRPPPPAPPSMTGIRTLKFLSAPVEKWNPKGSLFVGNFEKICLKGQNFVGFFEQKNQTPLFENLSSLGEGVERPCLHH